MKILHFFTIPFFCSFWLVFFVHFSHFLLCAACHILFFIVLFNILWCCVCSMTSSFCIKYCNLCTLHFVVSHIFFFIYFYSLSLALSLFVSFSQIFARIHNVTLSSFHYFIYLLCYFLLLETAKTSTWKFSPFVGTTSACDVSWNFPLRALLFFILNF